MKHNYHTQHPNKLKRFFNPAKILLLFCGFSFLFFSACQKEEMPPPSQEKLLHPSKASVLKLTPTAIKENSSLFQRIQQFNTAGAQTSSTPDKTTPKGLNYKNYVIDYQRGKEVIRGHKHSYTFLLRPRNGQEPPGKFLNIVFTAQPNGKFTRQLVAYDLTPQQLYSLKKGQGLAGKPRILALALSAQNQVVLQKKNPGKQWGEDPANNQLYLYLPKGDHPRGTTLYMEETDTLETVSITAYPNIDWFLFYNVFLPSLENGGGGAVPGYVSTSPRYGGGGGGGSTSPVVPKMLDWVSISSKLQTNYPCFAKLIMGVVYLGDGRAFYKNFLKAFSGDQRDYNISYGYKYILRKDNIAMTTTNIADSKPPYNIKIFFGEHYFTTMTKIGMASTVIHENMHAMLDYLFLSGKLAVESSNNPTYAELTEAYIKAKTTNSGEDKRLVNSLHHEYMAQHIKMMAQYLQTFMFRYGGRNLSLDYCKKIMWGGLTKTSEFTDYHTYPERLYIERVHKAEIYNKSYTYTLSNGTTKNVTPKGIPVISDCNK